jgi:hypothetical protein
MAKRTAAKRKLINTGTDKRYVRRDQSGKFKDWDDVGRSLANDRRQKAKTQARPGQVTKAISERAVAQLPLCYPGTKNFDRE